LKIEGRLEIDPRAVSRPSTHASPFLRVNLAALEPVSREVAAASAFEMLSIFPQRYITPSFSSLIIFKLSDCVGFLTRLSIIRRKALKVIAPTTKHDKRDFSSAI
jgi:hypothetical protein